MASIYGGASGNGWKLRLDYTVTQDRAANTSSLRLYLYANTTGSYNLEKDSAYYVLQGQKVYQTYQYTAPGWYLLGERTVTVRHGADGNGSVQLGGQWVSDVESSWTPASLSVSAAVALPRILRPSVLRAAELTLGQACVLTIRAEEKRYTHRVTYALGGASGTVVQETAQRELTWTPPLELARQLPQSVAGTMRLTVTTYDGGATMGSSVTECRVYVPDTVRPTAAAAVHLASGGTAVGVGKYAEHDRAVEGEKPQSLSSTASDSLERAMGNYLKAGDTRSAQNLITLYKERMTPTQKKRFSALFDKYGAAIGW